MFLKWKIVVSVKAITMLHGCFNERMQETTNAIKNMVNLTFMKCDWFLWCYHLWPRWKIHYYGKTNSFACITGNRTWTQWLTAVTPPIGHLQLRYVCINVGTFDLDNLLKIIIIEPTHPFTVYKLDSCYSYVVCLGWIGHGWVKYQCSSWILSNNVRLSWVEWQKPNP